MSSPLHRGCLPCLTINRHMLLLFSHGMLPRRLACIVHIRPWCLDCKCLHYAGQ